MMETWMLMWILEEVTVECEGKKTYQDVKDEKQKAMFHWGGRNK